MFADSLSQFCFALERLLAAARSYLHTQKTQNDLAHLQSLYTGVQLTTPSGVTIPPFRREVWPLESVEYIPASADGGETYRPWPQYRTLQRGNGEQCRLWIAELQGIADAVLRQIASQAEAHKGDLGTKARDKAASAPEGKRRTTRATRDRHTEARNKWIYDQCCKGTPHDKIVAALKKIAAKRRWKVVSSKQRIQQIGNEHADSHGLERPAPRQNL